MGDEPATVTYVIPEPFATALKRIRRGLAQEELRVPLELDVSGRIREEMGVGLRPCRVLYVDTPSHLLEATAFDRAAAALIPLHVVVSGRGSETLVHFLSATFARDCGLLVGAREPVGDLQSRLARTLDKIGMRESCCQISA